MRILFLVALLMLLLGCARPAQLHSAAEEALDLDFDRWQSGDFSGKVAQILSNTGPYEGKRVRMTGQYWQSVFSGRVYHYLLRSEEDGDWVGFELAWSGEFPAPGQTVLATGILQTYLEDGKRYLQLTADTLYETGQSEQQLVLEDDCLSALSAIYEAPQAYLGAKVTFTGQYAVETVDGVCYHSLRRQAVYLDGREGAVGLEFLCPGEAPVSGSWQTVTGTLGAYRLNGNTYLTLYDVVLTAAAPRERIKETP